VSELVPHSRNGNEVVPVYDPASLATQDVDKVSEWMDTGQGEQEHMVAGFQSQLFRWHGCPVSADVGWEQSEIGCERAERWR
jgi:hypothetical protein